MSTFKALVLNNEGGVFSASIRQLDRGALPPGEVLIKVAYSSLNYKDGLAVAGKPGVVRKWPMVPGVDLSGVVEESVAREFKPGDEVVVTGCGTSETMWGGYAQYARLNAAYLVPLPSGMTKKQAMGVGTAGVTAMMCVMALEGHGLKPGGREVLVTGAAGGVGSVAVAILARLGYNVAASTGRPEQRDYLKGIGASEIIDRNAFAAPSGRPLETERWAGVVDSVGGDTLAAAIRTTQSFGSVAACGLAGGANLNTTVFPFILRGVNLLGIDSVRTSGAERRRVWQRLGQDLPLHLLDGMIDVRPLEEFSALGERILAGRTRGRIVIDPNA